VGASRAYGVSEHAPAGERSPAQPTRDSQPATSLTTTTRTLTLVGCFAVALLWSGAAEAGTATKWVPHESKEAGRWSLLIAVVALLVVLPFLLWVLELIVRFFTGKLGNVGAPVVFGWVRGAAVGTDKRLSTSKTVAVVWTYALASALLSIIISKWWGHPHAYNLQVNTGLQAGYALLIGGPLGAAIVAKGLVTSQVAKGQSKPQSTDGAKASDLVSDDSGETDLGDLQYVLFNAVALIFFFGELLGSPQLGLPTIPDVLLGLTSVSAVGYVTKKALPSQTRTVTKVDPAQIKQGLWNSGQAQVTVFGSNLLNADGSAPAVRFENANGGVKAKKVVESTKAQGLQLVADIDFNALPIGTYDAVVETAEGNKVTKSAALEVVAG
jgi:hypothetical protein